jgi:hypothetical protein
VKLPLAILTLAALPPLVAETSVPTSDYDPASVGFAIGGILPREAPYAPLTADQRWRLFVNENFGFQGGAYFRAFGAALPDHVNNRPANWEQGARGYFTRAGDRFALFTLSSGIEHAGAALTGLEPRYVRSKADGFWTRLSHASHLTVLTYNRKGEKTFHWSRFAGAFAGEAVSASWNSSVRWDVRGYQGAIQQVGAAWVFNLIREFSPEIARPFRGGKKR